MGPLMSFNLVCKFFFVCLFPDSKQLFLGGDVTQFRVVFPPGAEIPLPSELIYSLQ